MIDKQTIDRIKSALNIVDIINEFVSLKKKGSSYVGICPFHPDTHPSMTVSPARQTFKCFVCDKGGDVIAFIQEHENLSFAEALEWCARKAGIQIENKELTEKEIQDAKDREAMRIALRASGVFFQKYLPEAQSYLNQRGYRLTDKVVQNFQIGYAPEGNLAHKELIQAGYSESILKQVGLLAENERKCTYDVFRDRIMFPFIDLNGNIIGFSGRFITPKENTGKYVNTGDTPVFKKGTQLFGLYQAKRSIARMNFAYLVEGQFDVLSLHAAGVENTIAGSGTALTSEQIRLISRFTQSVTLLYDADPAGLKASLKNCEQLLRAGFSVNCVHLPEGKDPDNIALEERENTGRWLLNRRTDFPTYFADVFLEQNPSPDPNEQEEILNSICSLISCISSETSRLNHIRVLATRFELNAEVLERKIRDILRNIKEVPKQEELKSGVYGLDLIKELRKEGQPCILTSDFSEFLDLYGDSPILLIHGVPSATDIQEIRRECTFFTTDLFGLSVNKDGDESDYLSALAMLYRAGITNITVTVPANEQEPEEEEDDEGYKREVQSTDKSYTFVKYYVHLYGQFLVAYYGEKTPFIERCADLISYADDSVRVVNFKYFYDSLDLNKGSLTEILKPYLARRKSRMAIAAQRTDDDADEEYNPECQPSYVDENPEYAEMYRQCGFYPKLNKEGEPVCYMFRQEKGGHLQVADFFMTPLLHIYSDDKDANKRVLKINRRYYKNPLYIEVPSRALLKKATIEEELIQLEAVNFTSGEEKHWTKIKEYMSRHFVTCSEILTYGNQQTDGSSRREDNMFFAFSNGIFHVVDEQARFDPVNELGVVTHNNKNYYLPAFSTIYAGSGRQTDKYELISQLVYKDIPAEKQCTFERWASLMDQVYKINDNGKWAILFAIMCAFRSNIHNIDRLFTAPFFMGPMSSGKTQIAISIRSLFISPKIPIFNLNTGTLPALSSLLSSFRDVPAVLDEYNNKDIQDIMFQYLKGAVYDGDGRQKRKGTVGKEIEVEKIYAPVIICGQETPQRDDNALMSRIIVCEVPKPKNRLPEEVQLFNELKEIEDPAKIGLSNVLFEILKLRPIVMENFRSLKQQCYDELKEALINAGEIDRLMKTASLFLATCRLVEDYTELKLPFTYDDFLKIACNKIKFQVELISKTDKLATFFKAMDVMIDSKAVREGRDFTIDTPDRVTIKLPGGEKKEVAFAAGTRILFLRLSPVYTQFARSSYNSEDSTQSTIEQNLRSHPSYIGLIHARRFNWYDVVEVPRGGFEEDLPFDPAAGTSVDNTMVRKMEKQSTNSSCIALNYDIFRELYDIDLQRKPDDESKQELDF
ncbi:DNA primase [Bacteroides fragilis]